MHPTSMDNMRKCIERYIGAGILTSRRQRVVEVGSHDVNGSYRELLSGHDVEYIGVDMAPGPGVDVVIEDPYKLPFDTGSIDIVLSGQMLEHCEFFWLSFQEMVRIMAPQGFLLLIAPSSGPIHRFPVDCYRFYPDAYHALAKYAGCHVVACWMDDKGPWNDLVGIFSKVAALAGRDPLPAVYKTQNTGNFAVRPEAAKTAGSQHYIETLQRVHAELQPRRYLEIGVRTGASLRLAKCPSVAIEPEPLENLRLPDDCRLYAMSSDDYFEAHANDVKAKMPDLVFIDGMHLFEFALRDFMNIERNAHTATVVIFDDVAPTHQLQATRKRQTGLWTGDVWRIKQCLANHRPGLHLIELDTSPTGLLLVLGLDPTNRILWQRYNNIVGPLAHDEAGPPPADVLARPAAVDPRHPALDRLLAEVSTARDRPNARQLVTRAVGEFRKAVAAR